MRRILTVCLFLATSAGAQTMYKCQANGKLEYSDKPCLTGNEVKRIAPNGGPTAEDRGRALMRLRAEQERQDAQERQELADRRERQAAQDTQSRAAEKDRASKSALATAQEKVLTHDRSGWDRKTRAQLIAEEQRKQAEAASAQWIQSHCVAIPLSGGIATINCN